MHSYWKRDAENVTDGGYSSYMLSSHPHIETLVVLIDGLRRNHLPYLKCLLLLLAKPQHAHLFLVSLGV